MRRLRQRPSDGWRWLALSMVLVSVSFSYFCFRLLPGNVITQAEGVYQNLYTLSLQTPVIHQSLYTPADYTLLIWGVIGFSLIAYAINQLLPSQSEEEIYDELAKPFILTNIFFMGWTASFVIGAMPVSMVFICCTLTSALVMYIKVRDSVLRDDSSNWLSFPFSLLAGWLCVVTIDSGALLLISVDMQGTISNQVIWTIGMILSSGILGIGVCFRCRDFVFPFVISWALVGIFVARHSEYPYLGVVALVGAAMPAIWIVTTLIRRISHRHRVWANKLSF